MHPHFYTVTIKLKITRMTDANEHLNENFTKDNNVAQKSEKDKSVKLMSAIMLGSIAIIALVTLSSCARKAVFQVSPIVPAARGYVKTKKDSNKNYSIYVSLEDLAEPSRLTPPKQSYVVWLITNGNIVKNIEQVKTSTSLFSHTLKGSFETVSATKPVKIFITAEDNGTVQTPGSMMVLTTNGF